MPMANTQAGGTACSAPCVCLAGAVPVPSANTANGKMGVNPSTNVYFDGAQAQPKGTQTTPTSGNPGSGVGSGTCNGKSQCTTSSQKVLVNGKGATRLGDSTVQNGGNSSGAQVAPSQTKVVVQ